MLPQEPEQRTITERVFVLGYYEHNSMTPRPVLSYRFWNPGMSSLTGLVLLLLFIFAAHGLAPVSPPSAINVPSSSTSSILGLLNLSSTANDVQVVNATNDLIKCDGRRLGYYLNKTSCEEAWKKMPTDSGLHTYGSRIKGFFERPTPYRYLSGKFSASKSAVWIFTSY